MDFLENQNSPDDLIVGFLKNELRTNQMHELMSWIQQSKENKLYFDECRELWIASKALHTDTKYNSEKAFDKFLDVIEEKTPVFIFSRSQWLRIGKVAAMLVIAFLLGGIVSTYFSKPGLVFGEDRFSEIVVPRGSRATFTLLDGTQVTLNAGSKLRYNSDYGVSDRVVELEGEGYFKVAKDKTRPFVVSTSHMNVKALGTEFNVKAYPGDKTIETTLVEGSVKIEKFDGIKGVNEVILKPNQKLTFFKEEASKSVEIPMNEKSEEIEREAAPEKIEAVQKLVKENVKVEPVISWKENRWIIEKQNLGALAVELERKFDIQILFKTERLKNFTFTGTLLDEPLEQVLKVVSITAPINYEINGKKVTVYEKENFERIYMKLYKKND
jgi:ferric-dicitrate binding protein FerR (iron transport regulator)